MASGAAATRQAKACRACKRALRITRCGPRPAAIMPMAFKLAWPTAACDFSRTTSACSFGKRSAAAAAAKPSVIFDTHMMQFRFAFLVTAGVGVTLGCNPSGQVKVYPVKGRVTFAGKPMVGGGAISFIPKTDQAGKTAGGIVKPDGSYVLGTYTESDGSMAGEFKVVIFQETAKEPEATPDGSRPAAAASLVVAAADRIPLTYANDRQTPLTAKVEPKSNEIDFDLKPQ